MIRLDRQRAGLFGVSFTLVAIVACKGAERSQTQAQTQTVADAAPPGSTTTAAAGSEGEGSRGATPVTAGETSGPGETGETGETGDPGETGETGETGEPSGFAASPTSPAVDPLQILLGGDLPETITILSVHEHGRRRVVLYRVDVGARWLAARPKDDPLLEKLAEAEVECDEIDNMSSMIQCREEAPGKLGVPAEIAPHLTYDEAAAWEVAEVEFDRGGAGRVLRRKQILDFGLPAANTVVEEIVPDKFKIYDIDGDRRSEIVAVFSIELPTEDEMDETSAALGFILDRADLHLQFATTRAYAYSWSDVSSQSTEAETTWLARDENGDGYADLVVRERKLSRDDPGDYEDGGEGTDTRSNRTTTCLYELVTDRWNCPEWLGTEVVDGGKRLEATTVPIVVDPPAEAGVAPAAKAG